MPNEAWVVAVDMGYGHQRAAYPLRHLSPTGKVLIANNYEGIPKSDRALWVSSRKFYDLFSRSKSIPLIGDFLFNITIDDAQRIPNFYPHRDLSRPNWQLRYNYGLIKKGWGKDLVNYFNRKNIPLVTTFFSVAYFAEEHKFKNDIYLVVCDSDISRTWAPLEPQKSRIKYLAPCHRVVERLKLYGVKPENIFLTGFPLPEENLGNRNLNLLKKDLAERLINLDPEKRYRHKYFATVHEHFADLKFDESHHHPLTLTFAVGGAGAQRQLGLTILESLAPQILADRINLNLVAGSRNDVYCFFRQKIRDLNLNKKIGKGLDIIFDIDKETYFKKFNEVLRTTDILWTKPSELVFYSALGLPIIIAPPLGSQEDFNKLWLKTVGAGIGQEDPRYANEWIFDWVKSGWLAEAAMSGFLDSRQFGVKNMVDVVFNGVLMPEKDDRLL